MPPVANFAILSLIPDQMLCPRYSIGSSGCNRRKNPLAGPPWDSLFGPVLFTACAYVLEYVAVCLGCSEACLLSIVLFTSCISLTQYSVCCLSLLNDDP